MIANFQSTREHRSQNRVDFQQYRIFRYVVGLTLGVVLLNLALPAFMSQVEPYLVVVAILLLGIPHGSTDLTIFKAFVRRPDKRTALWFGIGYIGLIGLYLTVWALLPVWAFGLFLLLSLYHFGQSNLAFISYLNQFDRTAHYLIWGAAALLIPILLHPQDAQSIVSSMTGYVISIPEAGTIAGIITTIIVLNFAALVLLLLTRKIDSGIFVRETVHLSVLLVLFFNSSLLMSFTIYFVFWHSLSSILDQNNFFSRQFKDYHWGDFLRQAVPVILICLIAIIGIAWYFPKGISLSPELMGNIFIALSLLTLPHMLLVDRLYHHSIPPSTTQTIE